MPKLKWNSRLATTAGRFCPGSRNPLFPRQPLIEVATYLRELPDGTSHIRDTILHEMIHFWLWHRKRPYGHTAEFHSIMKRVGAIRYNPVPKRRPVKHWYECSHCKEKFPARRKFGVAACAPCCRKFNRGKFHEKFLLLLLENPPAASPQKIPETQADSPVLPVSEIIRRLEELKCLVSRS